MVIAGAGGHAKELISELNWSGYSASLFLFDNTSDSHDQLYDFPVLHTEKEVRNALLVDNYFIIGVGEPRMRNSFYQKMMNFGALPYSLISRHAIIGIFDVNLGLGLNIMAGSVISASVKIGTGSLIHMHSSVHHDCIIGNFCELSPGCRVLGKASIGNFTSIGSNAVILPGVSIGSYVVIGAGSVVTKNVPDGVIVKGIPGRW